MLPLLREQSKTSTAEERVIGAGLKALEKHKDGAAIQKLFHIFAGKTFCHSTLTGVDPVACSDAGGLRAPDCSDRAAVALMLRVGCREAGRGAHNSAEGAAVDADAGGSLATAGLVVGGHPFA